jgi:hypothetical protein
MRPTRVLSPRLMIGKEHRSVTPTRPTMGILTLRKVTIRRQLVVPLSNSDDDLPLVKHDTRADLNPSGARIRYTQEHALVSDSPPSSPLPNIMSGQRVGVGCGKVLIPNPKYKGKCCIESASSNLTPRVQRRHPPPKIHGPLRTMEFTDDDHITRRNLTISTNPIHAQIVASILAMVTSHHNGWKTNTLNTNTSQTQHHKDGKTCTTVMTA